MRLFILKVCIPNLHLQNLKKWVTSFMDGPILYCTVVVKIFFSSSNNKNVTEHTADLFPLLKF